MPDRDAMEPAGLLQELLAGLLAGGPFVRDEAPFAVVRVDGRDAPDFLQRLCSQDVLAMAVGAVRPAAFLSGKGKLLATCLCGRRGETEFWLETQPAQADALLQLLDRYHFTEQVAFARAAGVARERVGAAAAAAATAATGGDGDGDDAIAAEGAAVRIAFARRGVQFERWHAAAPGDLPRVEGAPLTDEHGTCLRMAAGLVAVGEESEPATLALEAGLEDHVSLTKGCYTGQEIVARIHTYGHTNRGLALLRLAAGGRIDAPQPLHEPDEGVPVGRVMRAVPAPGGAFRVGLGYLPADFRREGARLRLADGGEVLVVR